MKLIEHVIKINEAITMKTQNIQIVSVFQINHTLYHQRSLIAVMLLILLLPLLLGKFEGFI